MGGKTREDGRISVNVQVQGEENKGLRRKLERKERKSKENPGRKQQTCSEEEERKSPCQRQGDKVEERKK
jgi:hypothetical protein